MRAPTHFSSNMRFYLLEVYAFAAGVASSEKLHLRCAPAHVHVIGDKVVDA